MKQVPLGWLRIHFARDLDVDQVRSFLVSLLSDPKLGRVLFEVEQRSAETIFRVGAVNLGRIRRTLESEIHGIRLTEDDQRHHHDLIGFSMRLSTRQRPLGTEEPESVTARILSALDAEPNSVHQVVIGQRLSPSAVPHRLDLIPGETWLGALASSALTGKRRLDTEARKAVAAKRASLGARTTVRLLIPAGGVPSAYAAALRSLQTPSLQVGLQRDGRLLLDRSVPLNVDEILALLGWPYGDRSYPGLDRSGATKLPPIQRHAPPERLIGHATFPGSEDVPVGLDAMDSLRHLHIAGPTGVGKSTVLLNLILGDIDAGRGVVVIDPKNDLVQDVLSRIPKRHEPRLLLLDPAARTHIAGFNPLAVDPQDQELAVDTLVHIMSRTFASSWGPRTSDILHSSLLTLVGTPWASLMLVPTLLTDAQFRTRVTRRLTSPHLQHFWAWFENLSQTERASVIAPLLNKLRPFLLRTSLRTMLGQVAPNVSLRAVLDENKVLLVPLRRGEIGAEASALFGAMIFAQLFQHTLGRSALPASERPPVMAFCDEFQTYMGWHTDLADLLAVSRGLGLGIAAAHQHLAQLRPDVKAAVLANAQSRLLFRLGSDDAHAFARSIPELDAEDLQALPRFEAYANLLVDGDPSGWMSIATPMPPKPLRSPAELADRLAARDGVSPSDVDAFLASSSSPSSSSSNSHIGRRPRGTS
ncbi:MAG: DUF87 domain-containing protein [Actinomycetota bacterium]